MRCAPWRTMTLPMTAGSWRSGRTASASSMTPTFIELPNKYDIHEYAIMERFCLAQDDRLRERLLDAIRGRGAFRRFRELARERGIEESWYRYRDDALKKIAADFLEAQEIPYVDEGQSGDQPETDAG